MAAEETGKAAVRLIHQPITPDQIITRESVENAFRLLMTLGGSTNAIVHLIAVAGRLGISISFDRLNEISDETPTVAGGIMFRVVEKYLIETNGGPAFEQLDIWRSRSCRKCGDRLLHFTQRSASRFIVTSPNKAVQRTLGRSGIVLDYHSRRALLMAGVRRHRTGKLPGMP